MSPNFQSPRDYDPSKFIQVYIYCCLVSVKESLTYRRAIIVVYHWSQPIWCHWHRWNPVWSGRILYCFLQNNCNSEPLRSFINTRTTLLMKYYVFHWVSVSNPKPSSVEYWLYLNIISMENWSLPITSYFFKNKLQYPSNYNNS